MTRAHKSREQSSSSILYIYIYMIIWEEKTLLHALIAGRAFDGQEYMHTVTPE